MKVAFVLLLAFLAVALATPYGRMRPVKTVPNWVEYGASPSFFVLSPLCLLSSHLFTLP
jgi:hypothetical protein